MEPVKKPKIAPRASLDPSHVGRTAPKTPEDLAAPEPAMIDQQPPEPVVSTSTPPEPAMMPASEGPARSGTKTSDTAHFDKIEIPDEPGAETEPAPSQALDAGQLVDGKFLSAEAFAAGMRRSMRAVGKMTVFRSLVVGPDDEGFPEAMAALYDSIRDTPMLHFLIQPGSLWVQRAMAIGSWAVPVGMGCYADLQMARRGEASPDPAGSADAETPEPANGNPAGNAHRFAGFD